MLHAIVVALTTALAGLSTAAPAPAVPRFDHVVVVVLENKPYSRVAGSSQAPWLNQLTRDGALFTHSYALTHPSEPNYLALFSGSTQGVRSDACPLSFPGPDLASDLAGIGKSFTGYAEALPAVGSTVCATSRYGRKHAPWVNFRDVPAQASRPFTDFPSGDLSRLPAVSFVVPDICHDMHDCSVTTGDAWLRANLGGYASWAATHNSLLVVTFDEDDSASGNRIFTVLSGAHVRPGSYDERIDHVRVLRTIEDAAGVPHGGVGAGAAPITDVWR